MIHICLNSSKHREHYKHTLVVVVSANPHDKSNNANVGANMRKQKKIRCNSISHKQKQPYGQLRSVSRLIVTDTGSVWRRVCLFIPNRIKYLFRFQLSIKIRKSDNLIFGISRHSLFRLSYHINWLQCRASAQYICFCLLRLFQCRIGFRLMCARECWHSAIFEYSTFVWHSIDSIDSHCPPTYCILFAIPWALWAQHSDYIPIRRSTVCLSFIANFIFPNVKK